MRLAVVFFKSAFFLDLDTGLFVRARGAGVAMMKFTVSIAEARGNTLISAGNPAAARVVSPTKKIGVSAASILRAGLLLARALARGFVDCVSVTTFFFAPHRL